MLLCLKKTKPFWLEETSKDGSHAVLFGKANSHMFIKCRKSPTSHDARENCTVFSFLLTLFGRKVIFYTSIGSECLCSFL